MTTRAQGKAQKRPKRNLSLYLRLILGTETAYNSQNQKPKQQTLGKKEYLISRVNTVIFNNIISSYFTSKSGFIRD